MCLYVRGCHRVAGQLEQSSLSGPVHCRQVTEQKWHDPCGLMYCPTDGEQLWTNSASSSCTTIIEPSFQERPIHSFLIEIVIICLPAVLCVHFHTSFFLLERLEMLWCAAIISNSQLLLFWFHWRSSSLSSGFWQVYLLLLSSSSCPVLILCANTLHRFKNISENEMIKHHFKMSVKQ